MPSSSRRPRARSRQTKVARETASQAALASNQVKRARNRRARPWSDGSRMDGCVYTYAVACPARSAVGPPATNLVTCPAVPVSAGQRDSGLARSIAARGMADGSGSGSGRSLSFRLVTSKPVQASLAAGGGRLAPWPSDRDRAEKASVRHRRGQAGVSRCAQLGQRSGDGQSGTDTWR